jgi:hypothetical protein
MADDKAGDVANDMANDVAIYIWPIYALGSSKELT